MVAWKVWKKREKREMRTKRAKYNKAEKWRQRHREGKRYKKIIERGTKMIRNEGQRDNE